MVKLQWWQRGSLLDSASLPQLEMQGQNPAHKAMPWGMGVAVVPLGDDEGVLALWSFLLRFP